MQVLGATPPKRKKARRRSKPKKRAGIYKAKLLAYWKTYPYWVAYWRANGKTERKYFSIMSLGSDLAKLKAIEVRREAEQRFPALSQDWSSARLESGSGNAAEESRRGFSLVRRRALTPLKTAQRMSWLAGA